MFSKTNVTLETCTQELASTFATMPALEGERPLSAARLAFLDGHRKAGTFVSPSWAIVIDKTIGQKCRANGQHSSKMLADCPPEEYPAGLLVTIEEYTTDDLAHDAFLIFNLFDHPRSARTNADVMNLHRAHYPELAGIDAKLCLNLCSGIAKFEAARGEKGWVLQARDRGAYLEQEDYRSFVQWAATLVGTVHAWLFKKPGVVAEMVANRQSDPGEAEEFWRLVFTESHPDTDHETRELSRTLREWARKPKVGQDRFRREAAKQWRRFRRAVTMPQIPYEQPSSTQDSATA